MFMSPVLRAKFKFPEIPPGALYSDRIKKLDIAGPRVVVIAAPAGYGKTTAVLLSLRHARKHTHWYRLEREDAALPIFFAHLIETLFGSENQNTDSYRSLGSIGNITEEYSLLSAVVCQDAWSIFGGGGAQALGYPGNPGYPGYQGCQEYLGYQEYQGYTGYTGYLVFDDFQNVADNAAICEVVRYLISNMPPHMHIIVISRVAPWVSVEKLSMSGDMISIGGTDLLFTKKEIEPIFSRIEDAQTRAEYAREAFEYSEGWIAGITLMKHVMEQKMTKGDSPILSSFAGDMQGVFQYLLEEVFAGADREMVRRAAVISLLDEFIGEDLAEAFQIDDPEGTIAWYERNNFYIQKIGADPPSYRFHSLFRDALRHVLARGYTQDEIKGFHLSAARRFEKTGRYRAAISHYLSGADEGSAVRAASERCMVCLDEGDIEEAASLIGALPERLIFGAATLLVALGCSLSGADTERGFTYIINAIKMAVKNKELDLAIKAQGFAISVCLQQNDFKRIQNVIELVPMPLAIMSSKQARKMLVHSLFLKTATSYKVRLAKLLSRFVDRVNMKDNVELWEYSTLLSKAYLYGVIGDYHEAGQTVRLLQEHPVALRNDRWRAFGLQLSAYLSAFTGNVGALQQSAGNMTSLGLKYTDGFTSSYGAYYTAIAKYISRDIAGAIAAVETAEKLFSDSRNHLMAIFSRVLQIAWQAEVDPGGGYAGQIEELLASLASMDGSEGFLTNARAIAGANYIREGACDKAQALLEQAWKWEKSKQAMQNMCGIAMHLAALEAKKLTKEHSPHIPADAPHLPQPQNNDSGVTYNESQITDNVTKVTKGDSPLMSPQSDNVAKPYRPLLSALRFRFSHLSGEIEYLKFFGKNSAKNGYVYFREMNFAALLHACARCVECNIEPRHMSVIVGKYFPPIAVDSFLKAPSTVSADPEAFIRSYPLEPESKIGSVYVKLFGAFALEVNGNAASPEILKILKTRKIIGIFRYIMSNSGKPITREKLAAAFWPDSDAKSASNSLRVALFELRKAMAALDMAFESGSALIAENKNGFYLYRPDIVETDAARFASLYDKLRAGATLNIDMQPSAGDIAILREMIGLYSGDFLEGCDASDCETERARYRAIYVEASYKLAECYRSEGKIGLAEELILKHLQIDPFDEKICSMLIGIYQQSGRKAQADSIRRQFTKYFEKEMGIKPEI